jgi:predicted outer membrane repeat protein
MKNLILFIGILYLSHSKSEAQTIYVNANASTNGDGSSWAMAFNNLQSAIENANPANEIWVSKGIYYPSKDSTGNNAPADNRLKTFYINKNIQIYGGFSGVEINRNEANSIQNETILSGDINTINDPSDNAYHVLFFSNTTNIDNNCIVKGLKITAGNGNVNMVANKSNAGGAIYFNAVGGGKTMNPILKEITITYNNANTGAGCYFNILGSTVAPNFSDCIFDHNTGIGAGGAIRFNTNNSGMCIPTFNNCIFSNNNSAFGACVYNILFSGRSNIYFTNTYFIKNSASRGGVMYNCSNGPTEINTPNLINCVFSENSATDFGGVIYNVGNNGETSPSLINCTFSKNKVTTTSGDGASMYSSQSVGICRPTIKNSILWNNPNTTQNDVLNGINVITTISNCIYSDGTINGSIVATMGNTFSNCIEADPEFVNENDINGMDNAYRTSDDGLNVKATSPTINAGNNSYFPSERILNNNFSNSRLQNSNLFTKDITGISDRIVQSTIDLGSFENQAGALPLHLISFSATQFNEKIQIFWDTANEINTQSFDLEKSIDGKKFEKIINIKAKNQVEIQHYDYFDESNFNFLKPIIYYRLKQIDVDGSNTYSKIIVVSISNINKKLSIGPNPVLDVLNINIDQKDLATLYNIKGIKLGNFQLETGLNTLNMNNLGAGVYFLKLSNGNFYKIFKQ